MVVMHVAPHGDRDIVVVMPVVRVISLHDYRAVLVVMVVMVSAPVATVVNDRLVSLGRCGHRKSGYGHGAHDKNSNQFHVTYWLFPFAVRMEKLARNLKTGSQSAR